jgi:Domain of unknown function (DUF4192)
MTDTVRIHEPRELLALIPFQLGFRPRDSAVVVSLRGTARVVGLIARVDLDDLLAGGASGVAGEIINRVARDGPSGVVLAMFTDDDVATARQPVSAAMRAWRTMTRAASGVDRAGEGCAAPVVDSWIVASTGYFAPGCVDAGCCPPRGRSLLDLTSTIVGAQMVVAGAAVLDSRDDLAQILRATESQRHRTRSAAARWRRTGDIAAHGRQPWREKSLAQWRAALVGEPSPADLGRIEAALDDVVVRDAVLLSCVPGVGSLPEKLIESAGEPAPTDDSAVGRAIARIVDPAEGIRADEQLCTAACAVLEGVIAHGRVGKQAPSLTLLGLIAWWRADGARAAVLLEQAVASDSGYRLAMLLRRALDAGLPPGWVNAERRTTRAQPPVTCG